MALSSGLKRRVMALATVMMDRGDLSEWGRQPGVRLGSTAPFSVRSDDVACALYSDCAKRTCRTLPTINLPDKLACRSAWEPAGALP